MTHTLVSFIHTLVMLALIRKAVPASIQPVLSAVLINWLALVILLFNIFFICFVAHCCHVFLSKVLVFVHVSLLRFKGRLMSLTEEWCLVRALLPDTGRLENFIRVCNLPNLPFFRSCAGQGDLRPLGLVILDCKKDIPSSRW